MDTQSAAQVTQPLQAQVTRGALSRQQTLCLSCDRDGHPAAGAQHAQVPYAALLQQLLAPTRLSGVEWLAGGAQPSTPPMGGGSAHTHTNSMGRAITTPGRKGRRPAVRAGCGAAPQRRPGPRLAQGGRRGAQQRARHARDERQQRGQRRLCGAVARVPAPGAACLVSWTSLALQRIPWTSKQARAPVQAGSPRVPHRNCSQAEQGVEPPHCCTHCGANAVPHS